MHKQAKEMSKPQISLCINNLQKIWLKMSINSKFWNKKNNNKNADQDKLTKAVFILLWVIAFFTMGTFPRIEPQTIKYLKVIRGYTGE